MVASTYFILKDVITLDIFNEQIIKKTKSPLEVLLLMLLYVAGLTVGALFICFGLFAPTFIFTFIILAGVVFYFTIKIGTNLNSEFEYSVTNNLFDVDKIIAKSRRKRLVSMDVKNIDDIGTYNPEKFIGRKFDLTVNAVGNPANEGIIYVVTRHPTKGKTLLIFQPNEKIIEALKKSLPYQLKNNI